MPAWHLAAWLMADGCLTPARTSRADEQCETNKKRRR
jgi:hypothetical protein